ncbi:MAG: type II CAAX prenyl endopeptidase Rce1 family protein [Phycisphaerae bacterium]
MLDSPIPPDVPATEQAVTVPVIAPPVLARPAERPPRVREVTVVAILALMLAFATSACAGAVFGFAAAFSDPVRTRPRGNVVDNRIETLLSSPEFLIAAILVTQAALLVVAFAATRSSRVAPREQLGLHAARMSSAEWLLIVLATGWVATVSAGLPALAAFALGQPFVPVDLYARLSPFGAAGWLAVVSIAPAICEELFFRGYVQRRLLRRTRPAKAIVYTSLIFAAFHLIPLQVVFTFLPGVWLGYLAWRTNSVWPGVICHGALNFGWNLWFYLCVQWELDATVQQVFMAANILIGGIALALFARGRAATVVELPAGPRDVRAMQPT